MVKRAEEVRIVGKYGTRPRASLRKMAKKIEISQRADYTCSFCGKTKRMRRAGGVWLYGSCLRTVAGGAWTCSSISAITGEPAVRDWRN
ncbi:hypothetical protein JEQ12_015951 [Ovis aries]|uniref:60S ribosomal protein L37a n=1 Tax=Ovis aries TaxID=9940 RepID=A0A836D2S3_SHEEP|nr:hypothetical protein JEQ12_015951 [Ovis aries]